MSHLAFSSREREVHVRGWERHRLPVICQDMAWGLMGVTPASPAADRMAELMAPGQARHFNGLRPGAMDWCSTYRLFFNNEDDLVQYLGHPVSSTGLILNTVLSLGSGPMKLAARFAGQMYSHAWIPGPDRGWAADLITEGLVQDVFRLEIQVTDPSPIVPDKTVTKRYDTGWPDVIQLLRETDRGPVVLSVSTGDDFPDPSDLGMSYDDWEQYQAQPDGNDQIWNLAEMFLINKRQGHKISQKEFDQYRFDHRLSVWDVLATDYRDRLDRAITEKRI